MKLNTLMIVTGLAAALVLLPTLTFAGDCSAKKPEKDIVQTAAGAGQFTTLLAALKAAGLDQTLEGKGPFTVFAPTDEAFAKLPPGTVDSLLKDVPKLKSVLLYHVVAGDVRSADVVKLTSAKTVEGTEVAVKAGKDGVRINGANVVKADIVASNGIIHVIDTVLIPQA
jgi:uncharacterized surface protein with fasciclin (FAS1) repeats